jgi:hypothetical protein
MTWSSRETPRRGSADGDGKGPGFGVPGDEQEDRASANMIVAIVVRKQATDVA